MSKFMICKMNAENILLVSSRTNVCYFWFFFFTVFSYFWHFKPFHLFFCPVSTIRPQGHAYIQKEAWIFVRFSNGLASLHWLYDTLAWTPLTLELPIINFYYVSYYIHIFEQKGRRGKGNLINLIILQPKISESASS